MKSVFMQLATAFQRVLPRRFVRQAEQYYFDDEVIIVSSDNVEEVWDFDDQEIYYLPYDEWQIRSAVAARHILEDYERGYRDFSSLVLIGADLQGASLQGTDFSDSQLFRANLQGANLQGVDFSYAKLREANLQGADLSNADLRGSDLSDANLCDANLDGAMLDGAFVTGTKGLSL